MKNKDIKSFDNLILKGYLFDDVPKAKGVIQIIHGMQEYSDRYFDIIPQFNKAGYIVFISDLRGHGKTAKNIELLGVDDDLYANAVQDQLIISQTLKNEYPNIPLIIFGHSFGSFVAQRYMVENGFKIKNIILCGSTYTNNLQFKAGRLLASTLKLFGMKKKKATLKIHVS